MIINTQETNLIENNVGMNREDNEKTHYKLLITNWKLPIHAGQHEVEVQNLPQ